MAAYSDELLVRIASALERQVAQHDESVARNLKLRDENILRNDRERDQSLAVANDMNRQLMERMDTAIQLVRDSQDRLAALESATAAGAVGQR